MKNLLLLTLYTMLFCCFLTAPTKTFAQSATSGYVADKGFSNGSTSAKAERQQVAAYSMVYKRLPALYSGYTIELDVSEYPLDKKNPLFRRFGNVLYDKIPEGGYSYLIRVNFSSVEAIEKYLEGVIIHNAPEARIIEYKNGKRKVL